jgi:hypothetical protein
MTCLYSGLEAFGRTHKSGKNTQMGPRAVIGFGVNSSTLLMVMPDMIATPIDLSSDAPKFSVQRLR